MEFMLSYLTPWYTGFVEKTALAVLPTSASVLYGHRVLWFIMWYMNLNNNYVLLLHQHAVTVWYCRPSHKYYKAQDCVNVWGPYLILGILTVLSILKWASLTSFRSFILVTYSSNFITWHGLEPLTFRSKVQHANANHYCKCSFFVFTTFVLTAAL